MNRIFFLDLWRRFSSLHNLFTKPDIFVAKCPVRHLFQKLQNCGMKMKFQILNKLQFFDLFRSLLCIGNCNIRVVDFVKSPKLHGFTKFSHLFGPKEFTKWKKFKKFSCLLFLQAGFSFILWTTKGGKRGSNFAQKINEGVKLLTSMNEIMSTGIP